jgi:ATP-dependent DNA helicase RecG
METLELLRLKERVEIAVEIGESYYREFKTALQGKPGEKIQREIKEVCYDIAKTLVAFANADGGELFVGIEDDNTVTGLKYNDEIIQNILKAPEIYILKETPVPLKRATIIDYNGIKVAYFSVEKGSKFVHLTSKGECFQRKDRESVPTASELIRLNREETVSREYDRQFVDLAAISDLNLDLIQTVAKQVANNISPEKFLQYLELAEFDGSRLRLRRAALLLFAKHPTKWHPRSQVRILRVKGIEEKSGENFNLIELAEISGNIFQLYETSWEALRPHLTETRFSKDGIFKNQIIYPELACKEALINAITHRDYSLEGRGIEIKIFDDRLEILSPGKLLSSITIKELEELKGVHQTRNTYTARVLREFGLVRELGEGIRRMFDLMKSNELIPPKLESPNKSFIVTLYYKYIYNKEEKLWLDNFENYNLSREQKTVVKLGINGRLISAKEIWENVGIIDTEYYRQLIDILQKKGILISEIKKPLAQTLAKRQHVSVKSIPRFKIVLPNSLSDKIEIDKEYDKSDYAKLYITNLPFSTTENQLEDFFSRFGEISDISIPKDHYTGKARGFGFIEFEKQEVANKILNDKTPIYFEGRKIYIQEFKK